MSPAAEQATSSSSLPPAPARPHSFQAEGWCTYCGLDPVMGGPTCNMAPPSRDRQRITYEDLQREAIARTHMVEIDRVNVHVDSVLEPPKVRRRNMTMLPNRTRFFWEGLFHEIPVEGRVIFQNIPIFATAGVAKTTTALSIVMEIVEHYGPDKSSVYIGNHIPSLVDAMRRQATPVQVLLVDDALDHYNSRGGGSGEMLEAIALFNRMRHEFEEAHGVLNGIIFVLFTTQMYKLLDKTFREGFAIFKSTLDGDKAEIKKATQMSDAAWNYLNDITREVSIRHRLNRLSDNVVCLQGYSAGRLHIPQRNHQALDRFLDLMGLSDRLIPWKPPTAPAEQPARMYRAKDLPHVALKYKVIEKNWRVDSQHRSKEEELLHMNQVIASLAKQFVREHPVEPHNQDMIIKDWLTRRVTDRVEGEDLLPSEVWGQLTESTSHKKAFLERIEQVRNQRDISELLGEDFDDDGPVTANDLVTGIARWLLTGGLNPFDDDMMKRSFVSRLYKVPQGVLKEALKHKAAVKSRLTELAPEFGMLPADAGMDASGKPLLDAKELKNAIIEGEYFEVDRAGLLHKLIEKARKDGDTVMHRKLLVYRAMEEGEEYGGKTIDAPSKMAHTDEGKAWQKEYLGEVVARPTISKYYLGGRSEFGQTVGFMFEEWFERKIEDGYRIKGVNDHKPIIAIHRGGGNQSEPDVIVEYEDGSRDYCSLKCYTSHENFNITTDPNGPGKEPDEIRPERKALQAAENQGVEGDRLVVIAANLAMKGCQGVRIFQEVRDIPQTLGFGTRDIGVYPWVRPGSPEGALEEEE